MAQINETIWTASNDDDILKDHTHDVQALYSKFDALIKKCHQTLYNHDAIVGKKAMDDIMKILTLKLLQPMFKKNGYIYNKIMTQIEDEKIHDKDGESFIEFLHDQYYKYVIDLDNLSAEEDIPNKWLMLCCKYLMPII